VVSKSIRPVKEILPHREPFLFIDEVVDMTDTTIVATRTVRADEPQFQGHYPGKPIMPGVLLCEAALQAGAYLMAVKHNLDANMKGAPVVTRLNQVRFKRMVKPLDQLEIFAEHKLSKMGAHMMSAIIRCEDKVVATLEFTVMLAEEA
jgi:3-hydroxyacyl-[acyl-carrier-protein] dehydratase